MENLTPEVLEALALPSAEMKAMMSELSNEGNNSSDSSNFDDATAVYSLIRRSSALSDRVQRQTEEMSNFKNVSIKMLEDIKSLLAKFEKDQQVYDRNALGRHLLVFDEPDDKPEEFQEAVAQLLGLTEEIINHRVTRHSTERDPDNKNELGSWLRNLLPLLHQIRILRNQLGTRDLLQDLEFLKKREKCVDHRREVIQALEAQRARLSGLVGTHGRRDV